MTVPQMAFEFVPLDCAKLARALGKSRWAISRFKQLARGMDDDPFHGGREATIEEFLAWRRAHPEINTRTKPMNKEEAA